MPSCLSFTAIKAKLEMPLCVYMDYETFWDAVDAPEQTADHSYTSVIGSNGRVASFAYCTSAAEGLEIPEEHRLALY